MKEQKKQQKKKNQTEDSFTFLNGEKPKDSFSFLKENRNFVILGVIAAVAVIAIAIGVGVIIGKGVRPASSGVENQETQLQTQTAQEETAGETETETPVVPLQEDSSQISVMMQEYYQAVSDGDVETIKSLQDSYDEETLIHQEKSSAYIESYENLKCYTKAGPSDNSYVVYASYEVKLKDMETLVPGVSPFLVYGREDGSYYIHVGEVTADVNEYLEEVSSQDDVVDLYNRVQVKFNEAVVNDDELSDYLAKMTKDLEAEVGEALANAGTAQEEEAGQSEGSQVIQADAVRATDVVNVRASDSEQADKIGKVQTGEVLKVIESRENGWTKVEYDGKEGFIKSEFLEAATKESGENANTQQPADQSQQTANGAGVSTELPTSGTVMVADTVNVRKSASESADKIGVCYAGEKLEILMQQADGWTKVKYKGQTGYVKTSVLKVAK